MNNAPTRRADPGECDIRILTPLPAPRVPLIAYEDHVDYLPTESPLIAWQIRGTTLHADITLRELPYEVECQTEMQDETIAEFSVDVTWLESPPLLPGRHERLADGRLYRRRYLNEAKNRDLFNTLRESAGEFIDDHSYTLCLAHESKLDNESAERALDFDDLIGIGAK
jgi:hypothetical protein